MINFANSEIFMYGTFASILIVRDVFGFTQQSEPATGVRLVWILFLCLVGSMFMSGILSVLLELVAYRRLRNKGSNKLAPLISAIGMSIVLAEFMRILTDSRYVGSPRVNFGCTFRSRVENRQRDHCCFWFGAVHRLESVCEANSSWKSHSCCVHERRCFTIDGCKSQFSSLWNLLSRRVNDRSCRLLLHSQVREHLV